MGFQGKELVKELLLGNEAVAVGAVEAKVRVVAAYPGTPSSEIADTLAKLSRKYNFYMEYSVNEKTALEVTFAAAISGLRALTCMKHVGLNVALDPFMSSAYAGVKAGFIVVSADDPNCWSSQNEQDNRYLGKLANVPVLEPSSPQECRDYTIEGFQLSEKYELPVLLRTTTRISHARGPVEHAPLEELEPVVGEFDKDVRKYVLVPAHARRRHKILLEKMEKIRKSEFTRFALSFGSGSKLGVITSGAAYNYVMECVEERSFDVDVLKLGLTNPIDEDVIADFCAEKDRVLVVEELEGYLEESVCRILLKKGIKTEVHGKDFVPRTGELNPTIVERVVEAFVKGEKPSLPAEKPEQSDGLPARPPVMCPGCPHRATFYLIKKALEGKEEAILPSDIGCYSLGLLPPLKMVDLVICMGASLGTACGFAKATKKKVVATIGDSTFFHAGIPPLVNAVYNNVNVTVVVLDNQTTAMTGHQPHPGTGVLAGGTEGTRVLIEEVAKGVGVKHVSVVDPFNYKEALKAIKEAIEFNGPSLVVSRSPCALIIVREKRRRGEPIVPYHVDKSKCVGCFVCINAFGCPAITRDEDGKAKILSYLCTGCGFCTNVCPVGAIKRGEEGV